MIRKHKWKTLFSSLLILSPMLFGFIVWDRLPAMMVTHWGVSGEADAYSGRFFAVVLLPVVLTGFQLLGLWLSGFDRSLQEQSEKALSMAFWIMPTLSIFLCALTYATAFGMELNPMIFLGVFLGVLFLVIGNYLPKCKRSRTLGIKLYWTLANDENWNATHRFGGKVWVICGFLMLVAAFLPVKALPFVLVTVLLLCALVPTVYSYIFYRKQLREGTATKQDDRAFPKRKGDTVAKWISLVMVGVILVFCAVLMVSGDVAAECDAQGVKVTASYYGDLALSYDEIESVEYRESYDKGHRMSGFGSPRLSLGTFKNEEHGRYTLYAYTGSDAVVVLHAKGSVYVIGAKTAEQTKAFYERLLTETEG